ncbi:MAG: hypothetical protein B7X01_01830, partial [Acidiphilium sp. 21-62-4]
MADRIRWERAQRRDDPLDEIGTLADAAPRSVRSYASAHGLFLAWLDSIGEFEPEVPVERRLTPERLGRFILNMRQRRRASTIDQTLTNLKIAMRALCPTGDWAWITRHPLAPTAQEIRASRKPIKQVDAVAILGQGRQMMDAAAERDDGLGSAMDFRNGLLLVFQTLFTLRRSNLAEIV